ncbi:flagellar hook-basal body complex protein FliE [Massilia sp. TW-1]|uniref:Flagellar hook-basal body complex protein FliE n=1 Tax=Telluria antibiotica TaxID=2717319 RepID=A0ABX0PCJ0_9BURK|nr:flagellar hook-basal body complex protein FliE [Telluria antibiotica]NIA55039.1 flagellar hook-basal body complex protein FliE [Telluria antibiotica]
MSIEAIAAIGAELPDVVVPAAEVAQPTGFGAWFAQEVGAVNTNLVNADNDVRMLAAGQATSLHDVMIHMEEAKLSFQLLAQVRNRLLDAYQEVMRMQV